MPASDTTPRAAAIQLQLYREADAARRVAIALDLSEAVRRTAIAGIRRRHPEYSERDVARTFFEMVYGGTGTKR